LCRCWTMTIGEAKSSGNAPNTISSACIPPREQPMTMTSMGFSAAHLRLVAGCR
jgi:hypothetical protein